MIEHKSYVSKLESSASVIVFTPKDKSAIFALSLEVMQS